MEIQYKKGKTKDEFIETKTDTSLIYLSVLEKELSQIKDQLSKVKKVIEYPTWADHAVKNAIDFYNEQPDGIDVDILNSEYARIEKLISLLKELE